MITQSSRSKTSHTDTFMHSAKNYPVKLQTEKIGPNEIRNFLARYDAEQKNIHLDTIRQLRENQKSIKSVQKLIEDSPELANSELVENYQKLLKANDEMQREINAFRYFNEVLCPRNLMYFNEIAPTLGMSAAALKRMLHEKKVIFPAFCRKKETMESEFFSLWHPYSTFSDKRLFRYLTYLYEPRDGKNKVTHLLQVTEKGRMFIIELFRNPQLTAKDVYHQTFCIGILGCQTQSADEPKLNKSHR